MRSRVSYLPTDGRLAPGAPRGLIQVGMGGFGRRWLEVVLADPRWEYAALATRTPAVREEAARRAGLPAERAVDSLEAALAAASEADAVLVTTPYFRHADDVVTALRHGKHVLVEKPLTDNGADAEHIRAAARLAGTTVMVGEDYRFRAGARAVHAIIQAGEIGAPEMIDLQYFVAHRFPAGDWRNELRYPVLIENNTHQLDLLRYVTGREALAVTASAFASAADTPWPCPSVAALIEMEGGLHVTFSASWAYSALRTPWEGTWFMRGPRGGLHWDATGITVLDAKGEQRRRIAAPDPAPRLDLVLAEFTAALDEDRAPSVSLADNLRTLDVVLAMIRSSEQQRRVPLPPPDGV